MTKTSNKPRAPKAERLKQLSTEIADLQRRIDRQIANLEAEEVTSALRRRIAARVAELEQAIEDRRQRRAALAEEVADAPPTAADLSRALDPLPVLADRLPDLPQPELRALFESLHLQIAFQPAEVAVGVEVVLFADEQRRRKLRRSNPCPREESNVRHTVGWVLGAGSDRLLTSAPRR
jgi:hypothetical protein